MSRVDRITKETHEKITDIYWYLEELKLVSLNITVASAKLEDSSRRDSLSVICNKIQRVTERSTKLTGELKKLNKDLAQSDKDNRRLKGKINKNLDQLQSIFKRIKYVSIQLKIEKRKLDVDVLDGIGENIANYLKNIKELNNEIKEKLSDM